MERPHKTASKSANQARFHCTQIIRVSNLYLSCSYRDLKLTERRYLSNVFFFLFLYNMILKYARNDQWLMLTDIVVEGSWSLIDQSPHVQQYVK